MKMRTILILSSILVLFMPGCGTARVSETQTSSSGGISQIISAADPRFMYEGRFDFSDPNLPVIIWQASRIRIDFEGDSVTLLFDDIRGRNYFNANLDDTTTIIEVNQGSSDKRITLDHLGAGRHHLVLFKRSEASPGTARFGGIEIPHRARAWAAANPHYKLTMEFIGDSLTAGACNEDGDTDQWEDLRTHNSACSYAAMTAEAFSADHRNIAVSGMGVSAGWTDVKAGQIWNRLYPKPSSPMADLSSWKPDVAFVFLGANDRSFTEAKGQPFPTDYTERYVSLVQEIRGAYPDSHIVLLMTNKYGPRLQQPWRTAVAQLEANDKAISHYVFERWVKDSHPRVADHRAMADGLILWLRKQSFIPHCQ